MLRSVALSLALLAPTAVAQQTLSTFTSQSSRLGVRALSMGQAGAFLPDTDPLAFVQNPARLAVAAGAPTLRISLDGHPNHRDFFGSGYDSGLGSLAATYGLGPGAVGVVASGLTETFEATDNQGNPIGSVRSGDRNVGVGGAVRVGDARAFMDVGATLRLTRLFGDGGLDVGATRDLSVTQPSLDLGAIATGVLLRPGTIPTGGFAPAAAVSAGYAQRGLGRDFDFGDDDSGPVLRPQDRTGSAGVSVQLGLDAQYAGGRVRLVALDLAAEALAELNSARFEFGSDSLIIERSPLVGSMRVRDALLGTSSGELVQGERGVRLTLAEAVWLAVGRSEYDFGGSGNDALTWGLGASVGGALRAIGAMQNDAEAAALGERFDLTLGLARENRYFTRDDVREEEPFSSMRLLRLGVSARL